MPFFNSESTQHSLGKNVGPASSFNFIPHGVPFPLKNRVTTLIKGILDDSSSEGRTGKT